MDKKIVKKTWTVKRIATLLISSGLIVIIGYQFLFADRRSKLKIDVNKLIINNVKTGVFQENIPETGIVTPSVTFYLDAIEGGAIRKVYAESGAILKKGDLIVELTNLNRELSVLSQEASLNESINRVRETRLSLEQNNLNHKQTLALIENELEKLRPQFERQKVLFAKGAISKQEYEQVEADFKYNLKRKEITYASYQKDSLGMVRQLNQLNQSEIRMIKSLNRVGQILDNLTIKSPMNGQLSTPKLFEGQAINPGQRLGQIDALDSYKLTVPIDEIYLPRITQGLTATTEFNGKKYKLEITYIYPTITNGEFQVDMKFVDQIPEGLRSGLSLRMDIALGNSSKATLIPLGGFYSQTGGNWIYVVSDDKSKAEKRNIKIGRKNNDHYEVISGLQPGEEVITSSYQTFGNKEVLILN